MVSQGYLGEYLRGKKIPVLTESNGGDSVKVFHSGTREDSGGSIVTTGGRVLCVTALGGYGFARLSREIMLRADSEPANVARKPLGKALSTVRISPCSEKRASLKKAGSASHCFKKLFVGLGGLKLFQHELHGFAFVHLVQELS